ncbi:MAG: tetratricopeptide repeat protein [Patescibacteria group bacterium]
MMSTNGSRFTIWYEKIAKLLLYAMAFLIPLAYFPWTVDTLEVNKQTILLVGVSLLTIAWLGTMVARKQFFWKNSPFFLLALLILAGVGVSTIFSIAPYLSLFGEGMQEYTSLLSTLGFILLFIVGSHYLSETRVQRVLFACLLSSSALVGTSILLALIKLPIVNTNFIGTPNGLGLFLLIMSILGFGLWLAENPIKETRIFLEGWKGLLEKIAIGVTGFSALIVLLGLDYNPLWLLSILGIGAMFAFAFVRAEEFPHTSRFILPMILFVFSIVFLFIPSFMGNTFAVEVSPSHAGSIEIVKGSLGDTSLLFGSGSGTFAMDYAKYHSAEVNATNFWDVRFDRAVAHVYTILATNGVVTMLLFLIFIISLCLAALSSLIKQRVHDEWKMTFVAFAGWIVIVAGFFLYSSNFTMQFLFWTLSAILVAQLGPEVKEWAFKESPRYGLLTAFLFVIVNVGLLTLLFVTASRYAAEVSYAHAVSIDSTGADVEDVITDLDTAARLNKWSDIYYRNLGNALLVKTAKEIAANNQDTAVLRDLVAASINSAKRATELSPNNVVNWHVMGDIYREVVPLVGNSDVYAVAAYKKASELAPTNPKYLVALARAYLVTADAQQTLLSSTDEATASDAQLKWDEAMKQAEESLDKALMLKTDYALAQYYLALVYERKGNLADAIKGMESVRTSSPNDVGVSFQLALLYLRQGKMDEAKTEFERAIGIAPNFSNALWYLSAIYDEQGDTAKAIEMINKVKELNPDNALVDQRLQSLQSGGSVTTEETQPIVEGENPATEVVPGETTNP